MKSSLIFILIITIVIISIFLILFIQSPTESNSIESQFSEISVSKTDTTTNIPNYEFDCNDDDLVNLTTKRDLFQMCAFPKNLDEFGTKQLEFELKPELDTLYMELQPKENAVVVFPTFTLSAYSEPGLYTFYRGECDQEFHDDDCLTVNIRNDFSGNYNTSDSAFKILNLLNYNFITDIDIDKNPSILNSYDTIILLHNEYVTKTEFDAITSHPKVVYLYPNALYAEVSVDYEKNTLTLIRGHNHPQTTITNGFDWVFDNTHPMEFDNSCMPWYFYEIDNGLMLSCYPENAILTDAYLLKALAEIDNPIWWNVYQKIIDKTVSIEEEEIYLDFFKLIPKK